MKFDHVLEERRSIRRWKDRPVEKDDIKKIIKAGMEAPSWKNSQCPRYFVVTNDKLLAELRENALPEFNAKNCSNAPCLIVACFQQGKSGRSVDNEYANECGEGWSYYDLGLASENICLKAASMGLGTLIMGIRNEAIIRSMLSIPEDMTIVSVIALGWPDIDPKKPHREKLKEVCKFYE